MRETKEFENGLTKASRLIRVSAVLEQAKFTEHTASRKVKEARLQREAAQEGSERAREQLEDAQQKSDAFFNECEAAPGDGVAVLRG